MREAEVVGVVVSTLAEAQNLNFEIPFDLRSDAFEELVSFEDLVAPSQHLPPKEIRPAGRDAQPRLKGLNLPVIGASHRSGLGKNIFLLFAGKCGLTIRQILLEESELPTGLILI